MLLVEQLEILAGCTVLAGTGTPQWAYWLGRTVRPDGPPLVGLPVGQVEGPTSLTGSAGWGLPSASGTPVSAKMDIFRGGNPKRRWKHNFQSKKILCFINKDFGPAFKKNIARKNSKTREWGSKAV